MACGGFCSIQYIFYRAGALARETEILGRNPQLSTTRRVSTGTFVRKVYVTSGM